MKEYEKERLSQYHYIGHILADLGSKTIDLIKIDVDSIDMDILDWIVHEMELKKISVMSIIIESYCEPKTFFKLQELGFDIYKMDHHLRARFFDARGRDVYKYRGGPIQALDRVGDEYLCRRGMRMLLKFHTASNINNLESICHDLENMPFSLPNSGKPGAASMGSYLITKHPLLTPSVMESWSKQWKPSTQGVYRNEKLGFPGEKINPSPLIENSTHKNEL